ncbi:MAG: F0F1 ATP synthase subunit alpha [Candidatus Zipacnadales bacterium]
MGVRPDEISAILKRELEGYRTQLELINVGTVLQVGDGIARCYGLASAMANELIEFPPTPDGTEVYGIAFNLEQDNVGCILMGPDGHISEGDEVKTTGRIANTKVGNALLGRVVTPLGEPLDDKGPVVTHEFMPLEGRAPGVIERQPVCEPLETGLKAIDSMFPIGRGQRELIIGDRQTGKTAIAVDTIINQRDKGVKCIYVAIGQKLSTVRRIAAQLAAYGALDHTIIVAACASDPAAVQYIAPYAGCAMGEYYRNRGEHALVIYDDLTKHAAAYRQVSLLLRRPPGREAFPGDIFNLHSRLLERAAKLADHLGGGSLTALPIVETQEGDFAAYIPTNVISITDGQIYLEPDLFYAGIRPAINIGLSVSRVGSAAQTKAMKRVQRQLKLDLASYREYEAFAQFASDLDDTTRQILRRGSRMVELLKQRQYAPLSSTDQVIVIYAGQQGYLDELELEEVAQYEAELLAFCHERYPDLVNRIEQTRELTDEDEAQLERACQDFARRRRTADTSPVGTGQRPWPRRSDR